MASTDATNTDIQPAPPTGRGLKPYRLSVRQYIQIIEAGILPEVLRIELLGGILIPSGPRRSASHNFTVSILSNELRSITTINRIVLETKSVELDQMSLVVRHSQSTG